jgi:hypothetical protein
MSYLSIPKIISLARSHVGDWEFVPPTKVVWTTEFNRGAFWHPPGTNEPCYIRVGWEEGDHVLWHEIFHGVFHNCPLRRTDGWWGEAFCNAFHGVNEQVFHVKPEFPLESDYERAATLKDINLSRYVLPCALILKSVRRDPYLFRQWFLDMNKCAETEELMFLSELMNYDPGTGKKLVTL